MLWKDVWPGTESLLDRFCEIFNLVHHQYKTVAEQWSNQGWDITFRRMPTNGELNRVTKFNNLLGSFGGLQKGVNRIWWNGHNSGAYKVNIAYKALNQTNQYIEEWSWKHIWKKITY